MINQPQATDRFWDSRPKQAAGNRLNEIFKYPFGRQGADTITYQNVKGSSAGSVFEARFFKEIAGNHELDVSEKDALMHDVPKYRELQNYLNDMAKKPGNYPRAGETVDQFIHRVNRDIVMTPEHAVSETVPGETMPVPETQNKIEIDKEFFKENPVDASEAYVPNNVRISNDKLTADIEFKYNSSGKPVDILAPKVQAGARIDPMSYLDRSNLQSFDARPDGVRLSTYMEIYNELKIKKMGEEADVVAGKIREVIGGIEKTRHGVIDYSKLPQEIREKLGK